MTVFPPLPVTPCHPLLPRICSWCGNLFSPSRNSQKYCPKAIADCVKDAGRRERRMGRSASQLLNRNAVIANVVVFAAAGETRP